MLLGDRRVWIGGAILLAAFFAASSLRRCQQTPEDRVRATLDAIEEGLEDRDVGAVMDHIHPDYHDRYGLDHRTLKLFLVRLAFTKKALRVQRVGRTEVELGPDGATAKAAFTAVVSEGLDLAALREAGSYDFEVELRLDGEGEWLVEEHRRTPR